MADFKIYTTFYSRGMGVVLTVLFREVNSVRHLVSWRAAHFEVLVSC